MREEFQFEVESKLESLPSISDFIDRTMRQLNIKKPKDIHAVQLSVDEACTNIIQYAYTSENKGCIVIRCTLANDNKFVVTIMDWGKSFDPTMVRKPDLASGLGERKEGGLGIFFMTKFMDTVKYSSIQDVNTLTMTKQLGNQPEAK